MSIKTYVQNFCLIEKTDNDHFLESYTLFLCLPSYNLKLVITRNKTSSPQGIEFLRLDLGVFYEKMVHLYFQMMLISLLFIYLIKVP